MAGTEWRAFNEKAPWGKSDKNTTVVAVTEDNHAASINRVHAFKRMQMGQGTAADRMLLQQCDMDIQGVRGDDE